MTKDNNDKSIRARNKTVMLTPDIANQMRSRLMTGVHRSGSTEKLDTGFINQVRENFEPSASREREIEPQTQIFNTNQSINHLSNIEKESEEEVSFLDALKSLDVPNPHVANSLSRFEHLDFNAEEKDLPLNEFFNQPDPEEDFLALDSFQENFNENMMSVQLKDNVPELQSFEVDTSENNFNEEIIMEKSVGSIPLDLQRGGSKQVVGSVANQLVNGDIIRWEKETPLVGFLVTFDANPKGDFVVLRTGRLIVSAEHSDKGNLLVINDESVSAMHAIIRISESSIIVLDQLSENGTKVQKSDGSEIELAGDKTKLEHGDILIFGDRSYRVCVLF